MNEFLFCLIKFISDAKAHQNQKKRNGKMKVLNLWRFYKICNTLYQFSKKKETTITNKMPFEVNKLQVKAFSNFKTTHKVTFHVTWFNFNDEHVDLLMPWNEFVVKINHLLWTKGNMQICLSKNIINNPSGSLSLTFSC